MNGIKHSWSASHSLGTILNVSPLVPRFFVLTLPSEAVAIVIIICILQVKTEDRDTMRTRQMGGGELRFQPPTPSVHAPHHWAVLALEGSTAKAKCNSSPLGRRSGKETYFIKMTSVIKTAKTH